jgi:hypothetical protein
MSDLQPPQMVVRSRMLYYTWIPEDPAAVRALVPSGLEPAPDGAVFMNQYVVDEEEHTSAFPPYSLTYLGQDLTGQDAPTEGIPGRWWTHYFNSSPPMIEYVAERGVPAGRGETVIERDGDTVVATTSSEGVEVIRSVAKAGAPAVVGRGQLRYLTQVGGDLVAGNYPFVATLADPFSVESLEFLAKDHPVYALRPTSPLQFTWGFYSEDAAFCYPGGEGPISV